MAEKRRFAVFDIDGTLIRWQLFHAIVNRLGQEGYFAPEHHQSIKASRMHWKNREVSEGFADYEKTLVHTYLEVLPQIPPEEHARIINDIVEEYKDQTFTYTRDLVKDLKAKDYLLFAVSGSHITAVDRVAKHHGFDDSIGFELEVLNGAFTGNSTTPIHNKAAALRQLVDKHNATYEGSYAVGDSGSDIAMLELVEHPIVFNPDKRMIDSVTGRGWPIVIERKNVAYELTPNESGYNVNLN